MSNILKMLEEREQYLRSMKLYHEEYTVLESQRKEKELELKRILGEPTASQVISTLTSDLKTQELPIPMKHLLDMDNSDRRYLIVNIAKNKVLIDELNQKLIEYQQQI